MKMTIHAEEMGVKSHFFGGQFWPVK